MTKRSAITAGVLLVLLGCFLLLRSLMPDVFTFSWPLTVIGFGLVFIIAAILSGLGGLAITGMIIAGIGGILYYQYISNDYSSWSYMWALIPGFVGLGVLLSGIIEKKLRSVLTGGAILLLISLVMFFVLGGTFGMPEGIVRYWPVILIVLGLIMMLRQLIKRNKKL